MKKTAKIEKTFSRWIRLYVEVVDDPKVGRLSDHQFRTWLLLLALAGRSRDGSLPCREDIAFKLRGTIPDVDRVLDELIDRELFDLTGGTPGRPVGIRPHNWDMRQYAAKTSAERMQKHRLLKRQNQSSVDPCNVTCDDKVTICSESVSFLHKQNANLPSRVTGLSTKKDLRVHRIASTPNSKGGR